MTSLLTTLGVVVWDFDPAIIHSPIEIRYYGILFALALAVGYYILRWRYSDENEDPEKATNLTYAIMIAVIVGTRLFHVFFYDWDKYAANPIEILKFWKGGLASHGAAFGIILTCVIYDYVFRRTPCRVSLDRLAMCVPFAMICVRLGNFLNSEIVGAPCDPNSPIAFIFTRYDMVPRYPTQLFEVGMGIIACLVMGGVYYYYRKANKPRPLGLMVSLILTLYFAMRFCVEFFKEYQVEANIGGLTEGQKLSIPFFIIGVIGLFMCFFGKWKNQNVLQYNTAYQVKKSVEDNPIDADLKSLSDEDGKDTESDSKKDKLNTEKDTKDSKKADETEKDTKDSKKEDKEADTDKKDE